MPPRLSSRGVQQSLCCQCLRNRLASRLKDADRARSFHATTPVQTRLRRDMFAWLNGPGKAFRKPLPHSSNYLGAYDKRGKLLRASESGSEEKTQKNQDLDKPESDLVERDRQDGFSEGEIRFRAAQREQERLEQDEGEARGGLPQESFRDLRPYPLNHGFRSQPVLSEELRQKIYTLIAEQGIDLKSVSAAFGVDIRRVAAVVRLVSLEKEWIQKGKRLAKPYNDAVLAMLPTTPFRQNVREPTPHEPINDLPVHPATRRQVFVPTSESRAFTRADAAKTFSATLLPADERIAHTELLQISKWENEGHDRETRYRLTRERDAQAAQQRAAKEKKKRDWEARTQVIVPGKRWDFKFQDISAEKVGKDGRGRQAVGIRYGMPHEDRKKGQVKIPTSVE